MNLTDIFKNAFISDLRIVIKDKINISNVFNIILRNMNSSELEEITKDFQTHFKIVSNNISEESLKIVYKKHRNNPYIERSCSLVTEAKIDIETYFSLTNLIDLIKIYNLENKIYDFKIDNSIFEENNFKKYITNYLAKVVVVDYSKLSGIDEYMHKYKKINIETTSNSSEYIFSFLKDYINFYNKVNFEYNEVSNNEIILYSKYDYTKNIFIHSYSWYLKKKKIVLGAISQNIIDKFVEFSNENKNIFIYMTELLPEERWTKECNLAYISIFEMLLTHNPAVDKYNVESSISKQFIDKISACLSLEYSFINNESQLIELKKELNYIYGYRSCITHGDFEGLDKQIDKITKHSFYKVKYNEYEEYDDISKIVLLEEMIAERLNKMFRIVFQIATINPLFIKAIK